ncbi:MAG: NfeD family protein [Spirochaetales bacterium]|uniref:NfeD family protein n=1 Tax=Candidatus Thalassospirochaeta sargassi TaxID=3119039 RepID=A0AAJ1IEY1_9SPIO|nr:NfeD family protein [Spirochaetales bacterium]
MAQILLDNIQFVWLGIAVILFIIEAATVNLATIWFALGALISMVLAFLDLPIPWQLLIFLIVSSILLIFTRPVLVKKLKVGSIKTNAESLVGDSGVVTEEITKDTRGQVKVRGQIWSALSTDGGLIEKKTRVLIEKIEGVTLYVKPEESKE